MICPLYEKPLYFFFSTDIPSLFYYSHIPTIFGAMIVGFFVYTNGPKILLNKILFLITLSFSLWVLSNFISWTNIYSSLILFIWPLFSASTALISIFSIYFVKVFFTKRDVSFKEKIVYILLLLPIFVLGFTDANIRGFDLINCDAFMFYGFIFNTYYSILGFVAVIWILSIVRKNYSKISLDTKKYALMMTIGMIMFLLLFSGLQYIAAFLSGLGFLDDSSIEFYGILSMLVFLFFIGLLIVRSNIFNINVLAPNALVIVLVFLVGTQFTYIDTLTGKILTSITLTLTCLSGIFLIKSVKKVDHQRELLDIANKNQQSLLHFITHQVKGYLAKSRNIFDGMIIGDYDPISDKAREMAKAGFDSDTKGVETVMAILKASDLKTGKTAFAKEKANVSAIVAEIIEGRKDTAISKGLEFSFEIEPNIETQVDQLQIKEVFKNLITNSILYTQKGTVHVVLKREHGKVKFSVVDTGVGLSPQDKSKLFTEGGKGEQSSLVNVDSTGYGLYIAKQIVEQHGGTIEAVSEGRGKGSEFFVLLPDLR